MHLFVFVVACGIIRKEELFRRWWWGTDHHGEEPCLFEQHKRSFTVEPGGFADEVTVGGFVGTSVGSV